MKKAIFVLYLLALVWVVFPVLGWASTVTSPTTGDTLTMGTTYNIQWTTTVGTTNVVINYSLDGGVTWLNVADPTPDDGSYSWTVPYTTSTNCKILITDEDGYPGGTPSGTFSIVDDGTSRLILTSPNGGEMWVAGKTYNITWLSTGTTGNVKIDYSSNNGTAWTAITASVTNNGSYAWTVPTTESTQCLVRISEASDSDPTDNSNANFSIVSATTPVLNLIYPNGGEGLYGGANASITWNSNGTIYNVKFEYSTDNGSSWNHIATSDNSGSYTWKVPNTPATQCKFRISDSLDGNPIDSSSSSFFIITNPTATPKITLTSPNGGEVFTAGNSHNVTWTSDGAIGNLKVEYSTNNGSSWTLAKSATKNTGTYAWPVPNTPSAQCKVKLTRAEETSISDASDAAFTIGEPVPSIAIQSPVGGETWQMGTTQTITWSSYGGIGDVKIQYSTDNKSSWVTIVSATANDGNYSWLVPAKPSVSCFIKISEASDGVPSATGPLAFSIVTESVEPLISLNRTELFFSAVKSSIAVTPAQTILVDNGGGGTLDWSAVATGDWLRLVGAHGTQTGTVTVSALPTGLAPGTYIEAVVFSSEDVTIPTTSVLVTLTVYPALGDAVPFGNFETPLSGATLMSSVPVTGWALDDVGIEKVLIKRDAVAGEGSGEVFVGEAVLVEGARPDVELAYPGYPMNYKAGWGYMMLTNMLPNGGNGSYTFHVYAVDGVGHEVLLGSKTVICDNINAVKPFGAIDTPAQGGMASRNNYRNQGWVLTPMPNYIPTNGTTLEAFIDGKSIGHLTYNIYRADIAGFFPGYANSNASLAFVDFNTTAFESGVHTIHWMARDSAGNTDGIGSRYFVIQQNAGYRRQNSTLSNRNMSGLNLSALHVEELPLDCYTPVRMKTGYGKGTASSVLRADENGVLRVTISEMERLVLALDLQPGSYLTGFLKVGEQWRPLPIGSSFDNQKGVFYWQPGVGFIGDYPLVLVSTDAQGNSTKRTVLVTIQPKSQY